ncbi:hypothetical protein [Xylanibacter muris]|uniref:Uncharacterized protein n=1 Tax=Xylanibacter muris TaxID=2736290 RepID=A0ABX2AQ65_9BACT|nr:hypothetical protein [Xylanibacter muris]NPD92167.1 hypothetical protein [Xylanibacter muris]
MTEFILSEFPNCEIIKEDNASITIGYEGVNGSTYFYIERKSKMISILYRTETTVFGKHELEWKFYEPMEQETIITKIKKDISDYNTKIKVDF